ncbi:MAG: TerC family protein [Xanthobacteraceae bacterium]
MLHSGIGELAQAPFWAAVLEIALVNILLSGDNAVIIAMACRELPRRQRTWGIALGAGVGVVLRLIFAGAITWLFALPYLKIIGGVALLYIGARVLVPRDPESGQVETSVRMWRAVWIVVVADIVMSFDNILALVEIANGDVALLAIGLAISIPLVVGGAALITTLIDRLPILIWAGAALLGWVAGNTVIGDTAIAGAITHAVGERFASDVELAAAAGGALLVIVGGGLWRRRQLSKRSAQAPRANAPSS